tara:strand:+ start:241 stop:2001 length:1761 start_codon:yes stop_codon:yes gene_type:complete
MSISRNLVRIIKIPLRANKKDLAISIIAIIFTAALQMSIPYLLGLSIDKAFNNNIDQNLSIIPFIQIGILVFLLSFARGAFHYVHMFTGEKIGQSIAYKLRKSYFDKLQNLSFSFHDTVHTGDLITKGIIDIEGVRLFVNTGILRFFLLGIFILTGAVLVLRIDLILGLLALSFIPFIGIVSSVSRLSLRQNWIRLQAQLGILTRVMDENLSGVRLVRSFMRQKYELQKFSIASSVVRKTTFRQIFIKSTSISINSFVFLISMSLVVYFGALAVTEQTITIGELAALVAFMSILQGPVRHIGQLVNSIARASAASSRLYDVLDHSIEVKNNQKSIQFNDPVEELKIENLCFSYGKNEILKNISFFANPKHSVGIVGPPGSGKTTLSRLLPRFYNLNSGRILLNGTNIEDINLEHLRHSVNLVDQDLFLFSDTFRENVRFGKPSADQDQIKSSTLKAHIYNHIDNLPERFETLIGERGVQLSGGQRQRLSVSRTFLFHSKVVIFDDSTSAIDTQTEKEIREEMSELGENITLIVIAHRISSVMNLDEILYLDNGTILERGNHNELIKLDGRYANLYKMQINPELKVI